MCKVEAHALLEKDSGGDYQLVIDHLHVAPFKEELEARGSIVWVELRDGTRIKPSGLTRVARGVIEQYIRDLQVILAEDGNAAVI